MSIYRLGNLTFSSDGDALQAALAAVYAAKERPLCGCDLAGVAMYIAKVGARYVVKRMPNTGNRHAVTCDHFEPPPELSGFGEVAGTAIVVDPDAGSTTIKLDFALSKARSSAARESSAESHGAVTTDGKRLTLRGTLHYLWDEAGFTRWSPAMQGRRSWYVIHKYLLQAAEGKLTKGAALGDVLFVPEPFQLEHKAEIEARRLAHLRKVSAVGATGARSLMVVVAEVKEIAPARYGHKLVFKHLPDMPFMMNDDMHKRLMKRFQTEIELWDALPDVHLIAIGTFGIGAAGIATLEEVAVMCVTANWIPFETNYELLLIDEMTLSHRRFVKGLRYNMAASRPLACLVAADTQPTATAMYILPPNSTDDYIKATNDLIAESKLPHWLWKPADEAMPALPDLDTSQPAEHQHPAQVG